MLGAHLCLAAYPCTGRRPFHPRRLFDFFQKFWVLQEPDWSEALGQEEQVAGERSLSSHGTTPSAPGGAPGLQGGKAQGSGSTVTSAARDALPLPEPAPCSPCAQPAVGAARAAAAQLAEAAQQMARAAEGLAAAWAACPPATAPECTPCQQALAADAGHPRAPCHQHSDPPADASAWRARQQAMADLGAAAAAATAAGARATAASFDAVRITVSGAQGDTAEARGACVRRSWPTEY